MRGLLKAYGKTRVYVLGAGFSAPLGMPCTPDLLKLITRVAASKLWHGDDGPIEHGQAQWLVDQLNWYFPMENLDVPRVLDGSCPSSIDIEQFMSFVSAHSAFLYKTSKRWNEHGDKFLAFLKSWIAEAIHIAQLEALPRIDRAYTKFADTLGSSVVLTFNWDTIIETLLTQRQVGYAHSLHETYDTSSVPLIKLHGSIDWFTTVEPEYRKDWMSFTPVGDSFPSCSRAVGNLLDYLGPFLTPWIVIPSYDKTSQVLNLGEIWQVPWMYLHDDLEVVFIGYSMRPDDWHARGLFYPQLVAGTRNGSLRVKVVDLATTDEQKRRVEERFIGVKNCRFYFDGFTSEAMDFINSP